MRIAYKLSKSLVPCVMLTLCIGFCYAFSLFTPHIASAIGCTPREVGFTFCLNIFFLGMGAATFGPLVESRIRVATAVSAAMLCAGLALGGLACQVRSLPLMYLGCGVVAGLAEGCGYVAPNKNMLLWFPASRAKGVLSAISIFTFGLGSAVCSWLFGILQPRLGIGGTFYALAAAYAIPSFLAAALIDKPRYALHEIRRRADSGFRYVARLKDGFFRLSWLYMFLNISMGLVLIGSCATILGGMGLGRDAVIWTMMMCGIANGAGRIAFPMASDRFTPQRRSLMFVCIVALELALVAIPVAYYLSWAPASAAAAAIVLIHACYGAAFAVLPSVLAEHYGTGTLSQTHGFCLTSWGMASLMAYGCTSAILAVSPGFGWVMALVAAGYAANALVAHGLARKTTDGDIENGDSDADKER